MLVFVIELPPGEIEEINSFSLGHMTFHGENGCLTSKNLIPDQSMMIFLSIVQLLDGTRLFLTDPGKDVYNFVGVDCSFQFFLLKGKDKLILKSIKKEEIDEIKPPEFIKAVWKGIREFMLQYGHYLDNEEIIADDLHSSIREYKKQFNLDHQR